MFVKKIDALLLFFFFPDMHVFLLLLTVVGLLSSMSRKLAHKSKWSWINQLVDSVLGLVFSYLKLGKLIKTRKRYAG